MTSFERLLAEAPKHKKIRQSKFSFDPKTKERYIVTYQEHTVVHNKENGEIEYYISNSLKEYVSGMYPVHKNDVFTIYHKKYFKKGKVCLPDGTPVPIKHIQGTYFISETGSNKLYRCRTPMHFQPNKEEALKSRLLLTITPTGEKVINAAPLALVKPDSKARRINKAAWEDYSKFCKLALLLDKEGIIESNIVKIRNINMSDILDIEKLNTEDMLPFLCYEGNYVKGFSVYTQEAKIARKVYEFLNKSISYTSEYLVLEK